MVREISNSDDVLDSRDIIARLEELNDERQSLVDAVEEAEAADDAAQNGAPDADHDAAGELDERREALADWDADNGDELKALAEFADEAERCAGDWQHGATLIRESYFEEYCKDLVDDIGDLPKGLPRYIVIDWKATADNLLADYGFAEWDGVTYYVR